MRENSVSVINSCESANEVGACQDTIVVWPIGHRKEVGPSLGGAGACPIGDLTPGNGGCAEGHRVDSFVAEPFHGRQRIALKQNGPPIIGAGDRMGGLFTRGFDGHAEQQSSIYFESAHQQLPGVARFPQCIFLYIRAERI